MKTTPSGDGATENSIASAFSGWNLSWGGLITNAQGEWWLIGQLVLILVVILVPGWPTSWFGKAPQIIQWVCRMFGWILLGGGGLLAVQGFMTLGSNLSPLPDPKQGIKLVSAGPYRICRHPLYLAVLICAVGVMVLRLSALHGVLVLALALVLRGKAQREERGLLLRHPSYESLFANTPGIAPGIPGLDWSLMPSR